MLGRQYLHSWGPNDDMLEPLPNTWAAKANFGAVDVIHFIQFRHLEQQPRSFVAKRTAAALPAKRGTRREDEDFSDILHVVSHRKHERKHHPRWRDRNHNEQ